MRGSRWLIALAVMAGCKEGTQVIVGPVDDPYTDERTGVKINLLPGCVQTPGGPCPTDAGAVALTVVNGGSATAYLHACGSSARISLQRYVNFQWEFEGPVVLCAQGPAAIALSPGTTMIRNLTLESGTHRITVGVATTATLSDEMGLASPSVRVP